MKRAFFAAAIVAASLGQTARAQDPQVVQALNEMLYAHGVACQYGQQESCWSANYVQQYGQQMLQAGNACQYGNQQACQFYNQAYNDLSGAYSQFQQQQWAAQAMQQQPQGYGSTHAQRMQAIQNFGAQNTANWNQRQAVNDANHQRFIESIRQ